VEIKVNAKHGELTEEVVQTMRDKVSNLPRLFNRATGIQVIADLSSAIAPKVEIIVSAEETSDFFASQTGNNVLAAFDLTISKIEQQLRKHKDKLTEHRGMAKGASDGEL